MLLKKHQNKTKESRKKESMIINLIRKHQKRERTCSLKMKEEEGGGRKENRQIPAD